MFSTICITGGTGSLGHALTAFLLAHTEATIRILSRDEVKQDAMAQIFALHSSRLRFLLGDIREVARLKLAFRDVDLVIHAAALKRIPQGELNPLEHIQTNITGTSNVLQACIDTGVHTAVFVSSDKAVAPMNLYGMTKAVAERLWLQGNSYAPHGPKFVALRYGNVFASRGSVIEVWRKALEDGAPLSLTHLYMSRFWLTLPEAVNYAWYAANHVARGCLFIPQLPAFDVTALLAAVAPQAYVTVTGVRPGEKRAEVLMTEDERERARPLPTCSSIQGYHIPPAVHSWALDDAALPPAALKPLEAYSSDTWSWRLEVDELRARIHEA